MPGPTPADYRLAGSGMGGAWDDAVGGMTTGYFCAAACTRCGAMLGGVEYQVRVTDLGGPVSRMNWTG